jgi:2-haloacid dehalogenase
MARRSVVSRREFVMAGTAAAVSAGLGARPAAGAASWQGAQSSPDFSNVKALVFDTFGTVVDWRTSVAEQVEQLAKQKGVKLDAVKFAETWRAGYAPSMNRVRTGELPWTKLDDLHRMILDKLLVDVGLTSLSESEKKDLNRAWHRLHPWPDAVAGLMRLKKKFIIAPLSNGNIGLMTNLAKHGGLPWDCILGAELVRHYKPDPEVYRSPAEILDLDRGQVMMVAAHLGDLRAAKAQGLTTAFVTRPLEFGPNGKPDLQPDSSVDLAAKDFNDLATRLGV